MLLYTGRLHCPCIARLDLASNEQCDRRRNLRRPVWNGTVRLFGPMQWIHPLLKIFNSFGRSARELAYCQRLSWLWSGRAWWAISEESSDKRPNKAVISSTNSQTKRLEQIPLKLVLKRLGPEIANLWLNWVLWSWWLLAVSGGGPENFPRFCSNANVWIVLSNG